jgi:hypothetical protein
MPRRSAFILVRAAPLVRALPHFIDVAWAFSSGLGPYRPTGAHPLVDNLARSGHWTIDSLLRGQLVQHAPDSDECSLPRDISCYVKDGHFYKNALVPFALRG